MANVANGRLSVKDKASNIGTVEGLSAKDITDLQTAMDAVAAMSSTYVPKTGGAFTGPLTVKQFTDTAYEVTGSNFDTANGRMQAKTISADTTISVTMSLGDTLFIYLINGGSHTVTWPAEFQWTSGSEPTLRETGTDLIVVQRGTLGYIAMPVNGGTSHQGGGGDDPAEPTQKFTDVITGEITTTPSGRFIARHTSGKASVIQYNYHGTARVLVVPDAVYRNNIGTKTWRDANTLVNGLYQFDTTTKIFNRASWYLYNSLENNIPIYVEGSTQGQNAREYADIGVITDDQMNVLLLPAYSNENKTARKCGDIMVSEGGISAFPALQACRNFTTITMDGGFDLPLVHDLCVLYVEGNAFDALDPTAAGNADWKLGKGSSYRWYFGGNRYAWSCQQSTTASAVTMNHSGSLYTYGYKNAAGGVLPVREIN